MYSFRPVPFPKQLQNSFSVHGKEDLSVSRLQMENSGTNVKKQTNNFFTRLFTFSRSQCFLLFSPNNMTFGQVGFDKILPGNFFVCHLIGEEE